MWLSKIIADEGFTKPTDSIDSIDLLVRRGDQLHKAILLIVGIYGLIYSILNYAYGDYLQSVINITLVPSTVISYLILKGGRTIASKIWSLTHVIIVLSLHSLIRTPQSMILAFFIPVIVSTLIVFQGEARKLGYLLTICVLVIFTFLITTDFTLGDTSIIGINLLRREWMMNLPGAVIVTIMEVLFILSINTSIQNELLAKTHDLGDINNSLNSIIKTREKLISILSHDFRGPVITINAGLEMLYEDEIESGKLIDPRKKKIYTELLKKTKSTITLMDDLLLWSRSQTNQINCTSESNSFGEIKDNIIDFCELHAGSKNVKFNIDIPKTGYVLADKKLLNGIMLNLISNAVKFSNVDGKIDIKIQEAQTNWEFLISDYGIGIDQTVLERIKSGQYYTTNGTDNERGHGLGLQLVREFLEKHNSQLEIQSEVGKGTTMSFKLAKA